MLVLEPSFTYGFIKYTYIVAVYWSGQYRKYYKSALVDIYVLSMQDGYDGALLCIDEIDVSVASLILKLDY